MAHYVDNKYLELAKSGLGKELTEEQKGYLKDNGFTPPKDNRMDQETLARLAAIEDFKFSQTGRFNPKKYTGKFMKSKTGEIPEESIEKGRMLIRQGISQLPYQTFQTKLLDPKFKESVAQILGITPDRLFQKVQSDFAINYPRW